MSTSPRILIVDAGVAPGELQARLTDRGYDVRTSESGKIALCTLGAEVFDLVLLDLGLPDLPWRDFIATAHDLSQAPIISLSASTTQSEKIEALDLGASDYLTKPFDMDELLARVRAALRLYEAARATTRRHSSPERLTLDISTRRAIVDGRVVRLSIRECAALQLLAETDGLDVRFEEIIERVWNRRIAADAQRVRVLMWQLRRKIEPDPTRPCFIISEPGLGYRLNRAGLGRTRTPERSY